MSGDNGPGFLSQVLQQPLEKEKFLQLKNAVRTREDPGFQLNSTGGPLENDFTGM